MIDPNASAYPCDHATGFKGLTIRQEFAKAAMQGLIAFGWNGNRDDVTTVKKSISIADQLINELNK